jgi:hypothetical protein
MLKDITYPIINDIDRITVAGGKDYNAEDHSIVGFVGSTLYVRELIRYASHQLCRYCLEWHACTHPLTFSQPSF